MRAARALMRHQRGFIDKLLAIFGALLVLALAGRFLYWVATEESFGEVAVVLWAIGFVVSYWIAADDVLVARMPAGFAVFALLALAAVPLTCLGESRVALLALLGAQLAFSYYAGLAITGHVVGRVLPRYPSGSAPAWLGQQQDIVAGLGNWAVVTVGAALLVWVGPLLVLALISAVHDIPQQAAIWICAAWGVIAITFLAGWMGAARWNALPVASWIYFPITAALLAIHLLAGPLAERSGLQVASVVLPGALIAAFVEIFLLGGGRKQFKRQSSEEEA
jgi:hypothetical protein